LNTKRVSLTFAIVLIAMFLPLVLDNYYLHLMNQIGIFVILTSSLNLVVGYTGQLSFAHVGLFAIGAYTSAMMTTLSGFSVWAAIPIGAIVAGVFGLLVGIPSLRFKTHFFAIVTLGFAEIIRLVIYNLEITGGPNGVYNIPYPENFFGFDFTQRFDFYYIVLLAVLSVLVFKRYLIRSRLGKAMIAVRENETFAEFVGINTWRIKILSFVISAVIAGFAGSLYAHYNAFISPYSFTVAQSVSFLLMLIIGGMGTLVGPILGTAFLTILPEVLRSIADYRMIIFGALLVLSIRFMPQGLVGKFTEIRAKYQFRGKIGNEVSPSLGTKQKKEA
jgi:branched-chain amino acid transport system permease protein